MPSLKRIQLGFWQFNYKVGSTFDLVVSLLEPWDLFGHLEFSSKLVCSASKGLEITSLEICGVWIYVWATLNHKLSFILCLITLKNMLVHLYFLWNDIFMKVRLEFLLQSQFVKWKLLQNYSTKHVVDSTTCMLPFTLEEGVFLDIK